MNVTRDLPPQKDPFASSTYVELSHSIYMIYMVNSVCVVLFCFSSRGLLFRNLHTPISCNIKTSDP